MTRNQTQVIVVWHMYFDSKIFTNSRWIGSKNQLFSFSIALTQEVGFKVTRDSIRKVRWIFRYSTTRFQQISSQRHDSKILVIAGFEIQRWVMTICEFIFITACPSISNRQMEIPRFPNFSPMLVIRIQEIYHETRKAPGQQQEITTKIIVFVQLLHIKREYGCPSFVPCQGSPHCSTLSVPVLSHRT